MKITRLIAAPIAAAAIVVGSTVGITGVASAEPAVPEMNFEGFAKQLGITTTIGGFAGTALGAGIGCALGAGSLGAVAPVAGSVTGCLGGGALGGLVAGAGVGGIVGTVLGGSAALPELFAPVAP